MFKIISIELKKKVARPGIWVLAVLLAIVLVLGAFIYKPEVASAKKFVTTGTTFNEKYSNFVSITIDEYEGNQGKINSAIELIENYEISGSTYKKAIEDQYKEFKDNYRSYIEETAEGNMASKRALVLTSLENLNAVIKSAESLTRTGSFPLLTTEENLDNYEDCYKKIHTLFSNQISLANLPVLCEEFETEYNLEFKSIIDKFSYTTLEEELVTDLTELSGDTKLALTKSRIEEIKNELLVLNDETSSLETTDPLYIENLNKLEELTNRYVGTCEVFINIVKFSLVKNAFDSSSFKDYTKIVGLKNYIKLENEANLVKFNYLFKNGKIETDFASPLAISKVSNIKINAFDYAYFVLKLFSFLIVVYAILSACTSLAGENKDGSLRYLAMRPISRKQILFGKMFANLIMCIILTVFSTIIAVGVGGVIYGFAGGNILAVFNGKFAINVHPLLYLCFYIISFIFELLVYISLATLISCFVKNDSVPFAVCLVLYLINLLLPAFFGGANSWLIFYPFSYISLFALFGNTANFSTDNLIARLIDTKIYATTNIFSVVAVIVGIILICQIISVKIFKKKDL